MKRRTLVIGSVLAVVGILALLGARNFSRLNMLLNRVGIQPIATKTPAYYLCEDFGIEAVKSDVDYNGNGVDDYTDIVDGARAEAQRKPKYHSAYYDGGYPPDDEGVCSDTVWRALKHAGYNLKDLIDADIVQNPDWYTDIEIPDPNIDFRRVKNLKVFFDHHYLNLAKDPYQIGEWMGGDLVIFGNSHIAVVSDRRNKEGIAYLIHNAAQYNREEDALIAWDKKKGITGHYRFVRVLQ